MTATVEEVAALADLDLFFQETGANGTYGECHNAVTWLAIQIKKNDLVDYNVFACTGAFAGRDHSWMMVQDVEKDTFTVVDMTVDQFGECDVPYVGPLSPGYVMHNSVSLCDIEALDDFVRGLG